ncbi:MAG TPA: HDOD domain-containing protein [Steroidobacteraceae bacterium]|nr:HDOD domain-containing protein [Steroidobacteraceae bacterium]
MLLVVGSIGFVAVVGTAIWLLARQLGATPSTREKVTEWVFANPAELSGPPVGRAATGPGAVAKPGETATGPEGSPLPAEVLPLTAEEILGKLHQLSLGPAATEPCAEDHSEVVAATTRVLETAATEDRYAPRRPTLLPQLMRAMNDEEVSRRELVTIISRDPSLVGNLLKMANSPFYRVSSQAVESIDRAVVILGNEGIRSLIATALAQPIFQIRAGAFPRFPEIAWEHTFRTASATVTHAAIVERSDPFAAQLLGLVAGMASIVVFRVALDQYEARPKFRPHPSVIALLLDAQSVPVAKMIAASWGLSERIQAALDDQTAAVDADRHTPLGRSLRFGRLASALGVLRLNESVDDVVAQISLPIDGMPATDLARLWSRLSAPTEATPKKKPAPPAPPNTAPASLSSTATMRALSATATLRRPTSLRSK